MEQLEKALIVSARYSRQGVLQYLIDKGVDFAASEGTTVMRHATRRADLETVRLLIRRGAPAPCCMRSSTAAGGDS